MYKRFFHLDANPFGNNPDPRFLCMLPHTREALACLEHGIAARKGFIVLTGEVGTGKTTLLRRSLSALHAKPLHISFVFNPRLDPLDFLEIVLTDFGITPAARTKSGMLTQLNRFLIQRFAQRETCVLVVDEAQNLSPEMLEEVRLLTNLETDTEKLLQIVLSGQSELEDMLRQASLRQLRQRVALWCRTRALTRNETAEYIVGRLAVAGSSEPIFEQEAIDAIYRYSEGIPRLINLTCEHALITAYVEELHRVPERIIHSVASDIGLGERHAGFLSSSDRDSVGVAGAAAAGQARFPR